MAVYIISEKLNTYVEKLSTAIPQRISIFSNSQQKAIGQE